MKLVSATSAVGTLRRDLVSATLVVALALMLIGLLYASGEGSVGAQALGMGGAYVGLAEGPLAVYWNPAALANIEEVQVTIEGVVAGGDVRNFAALVIPVGEGQAVGVGYWREPYLRAEDWKKGTVSLKWAQEQYALAYGRRVSNRFAVGVKVRELRDYPDCRKLFRWTLQPIEYRPQSGTPVDVGLLYEAGAETTLGLQVLGVNGTETYAHLWSGTAKNFRQKHGPLWHIGMASTLGRGTVTADLFDAGNLYERQVRLGAALPLGGGVALRGGWAGGDGFAAGVGLTRGRATIEAAYAGEGYILGVTWR